MATFAQFFQRQFLIDGVPLTDGKLYHYIADTSTDKHMWNERTKATTVAQPLVSDANGVFSAYGDGLYKLVLTSSAGISDPIYTWDYVNITDADPRGEGAAIASASTLVLGPDGDFFHVTGTTTIDAINGTQVMVTLVFDGILTLTHSSSLILNGGVDFLTEVGTIKQFINEGSNIWREIALTLDTVVVDIKVKKADPIIRLKNTADTAKEYAVGNDSDNFGVWENTGTESTPVWAERLFYNTSLTEWQATGDLTASGDISGVNLVDSLHDHTTVTKGGILVGNGLEGNDATFVTTTLDATNFPNGQDTTATTSHTTVGSSKVLVVAKMQLFSYADGGDGDTVIRVLRDSPSNVIDSYTITFGSSHVAPSSLTLVGVDAPSAGTYTYKINVHRTGSAGGDGSVTLNEISLATFTVV